MQTVKAIDERDVCPLVRPVGLESTAAGRRSFRIRHACMGIGLPVEAPALARIRRCKRNYVAEPGRYKLDAHSSSDN